MNCFKVTKISATLPPLTTEAPSTPRFSEHIKYYIMDVAVPCVCVLGLVGNLLSLMVLTTEKLHRTLTKMETSAHIGLIALAVSDFLFCLLVFVFTQVYLKSYYEVGDTMVYFDFLANGLITLFIISSTWLIVVMAAERYIAVCHPLRARKLISLRRTRASIIIVFVICGLSTIPIFMERRIVEVLCDDGRTVYRLEERNQYSVKLRRILWAVFFDFIPCLALVYFNVCLIIQIRRAKRLRDRMTPKHSIIRYTSSGPKTTAQLLNSAQNPAFNCKSVYAQRMDIKQARMHSMYTEVTGSKDKHSQDYAHFGNGTKQQPKIIYNGREKSSRSSGGPSSHSTDNEMKSLNTNRIRRGTMCSGSSKKGDCVMAKRRPSDSALNSVTATLVAVVLLFLILVSPSELMKFSVGYTLADKEYKLIVTYVTNFMQVLNFSLNFVLYCAVNKTFRHTLRGLICCCWLTIQG